MRPSYEALPSWLSRLPAMAPTPVRAHRPPEENALQRALANPRLPLHIGLMAVGIGIGAAVTARSVRAEHTAESHAQMSAYAESKAAELRSFATLRSARSQVAARLAPGGSLTANVAGYFDVVEGTDGRRFYRRWDVDGAPTGSRRIVVRVVPASPRAGRDSLDLTSIIPRP